MFVSVFFPVFLGLVFVLFFLLPAKCRPFLLLGASLCFCARIDLRALAVLLLISVCTWAGGMQIERLLKKGRERSAKGWLVFWICSYIILLCVYKYVPAFASFVCQAAGGASGEVGASGTESPGIWSALKRMVMPVGISFYLFQAIGYLADVYRQKTPAEKNFWYLSCYLAFFPKLVSGPIEREQEFLPQLRRLEEVKPFHRGRLSLAFTYILWGYFMKMVVADRLAVTVNQIFGDPARFDSAWLAAGAFFYTIQIYCDFAGYSYIAVGCGELFGIKLTQNFRAPYCASGIGEFWRRWHVSLSSWLRDYLYIPLGGNRRGTLIKCRNTMIVFLVCGMWHGAGLNFVVWGLLHGIYSVLEELMRKAGWHIKGGRLLTFAEVAFAWIFFRADSLYAAVDYVTRMFTTGIRPADWKETALSLQLGIAEISLILIGILVVWAVDEFCSRKRIHLPAAIQQKKNAGRYFAFYLLIMTILIFGIYGPGYHTEQFIYMQF